MTVTQIPPRKKILSSPAVSGFILGITIGIMIGIFIGLAGAQPIDPPLTVETVDELITTLYPGEQFANHGDVIVAFDESKAGERFEISFPSTNCYQSRLTFNTMNMDTSTQLICGNRVFSVYYVEDGEVLEIYEMLNIVTRG